MQVKSAPQVQEKGDRTLVAQSDVPSKNPEAETALSDKEGAPQSAQLAPQEPESPILENEWVVKYDGEGASYDDARRQCSITHLRPGAVYGVRVCARNRAGRSVPHELATCLVMQPSMPEAPTAPLMLSTYAVALELGWSQPCVHGAPISAYKLEMSSKGIDGEFGEVYAGTELRCKVFNLKPACRYHFRVIAENSCGASPPSGVSEMTTNPIVHAQVARVLPPKISTKGRGGLKKTQTLIPAQFAADEEMRRGAEGAEPSPSAGQRGGKGRAGSKGSKRESEQRGLAHEPVHGFPM